VSLGLISGLGHELLRLRTRAGHDPLDLYGGFFFQDGNEF